MLKIYHVWGEIWISKSMKLVAYQKPLKKERKGKKETANQKYSVQQSYTSEMMKRERLFHMEKRQREPLTTRPALQELLEGVLAAELNGHYLVT